MLAVIRSRAPIGSCAGGTGSSQETAHAKANLRHLQVNVAQAKEPSEINRTEQPPAVYHKLSKSKSSHRGAFLLSACIFLGSACRAAEETEMSP